MVHRTRGKWGDLLAPESELAHEMADAVHRKLLETTASRASTRPLPALNSYELFLGGISMMHRASADDFELSRRLLESLTERHRRIATPHAWLGKWYVLRAIQGAISDLPEAAARRPGAHAASPRSRTDQRPRLGHRRIRVLPFEERSRDAEARLLEACSVNPSEGFGWLFLAVMNAFQGKSAAALEAGHRALALLAMDPLRYYYESLMGSCEFGAENYAEAIRWCEASRRRNRQHLSTLRILIAAYAATGHGASYGHGTRSGG